MALITGGGSGGTIAVLAKHDAEEAIARVVAQYGAETGLSITVFRGSSSGAFAWGWLQLQKQ
jgi:L-arabinokinase